MDSCSWRVESCRWKMDSYSWRVESCRWRVESYKWRVQSIRENKLLRLFQALMAICHIVDDQLTRDNEKSTIVTVKNQYIEIDNSWIVPYSPSSSKTFKTHINIEYCHSVKSIEHICEYVNEGSDMAVIGVSSRNHDEIDQYRIWRYISSNEAIWRIFLNSNTRKTLNCHSFSSLSWKWSACLF